VQIAATVRQWLDDGTFNPGDKVTITDLAERYGVSRGTAARGLHILEGEGRLRRFPGFGYAVQDTRSATGPGAAACDGPTPGDG
jgi:DNA-binding GntR family transcriptional regulator